MNPIHTRTVALIRGSPTLREWANAHRAQLFNTIGRAHRQATTRSLTIFRMGLGRDSIAMLCLLVEDGLIVGGRKVVPLDIDAVVFTDPGAEWSNTYALIPRVAEFCERNGLRFIVIAKPAEEGPRGWKSWIATRQLGSRAVAPWRQIGDANETVESRAARGFYQARAPIMADYASRGVIVQYKDTSCTVNHKIGPNRALMNDLSLERFGIDNRKWSDEVKKHRRPPHRLLLGIAADEAERAGLCPGPLYEATFYPLVEMGVAKAMETAILARHGFDDTKKSGCSMCKFQPIEWYWALSVTDPAKFAEVVAYEANALQTSPNLLLMPKGVLSSNGWDGDPRPAKERPKLPIAASVALWYELNKHRKPTVDEVLAKAYKRCDRADGSIVRSVEPDGGHGGAKANPKVACVPPPVAFAYDARRIMEVMAADGFETSFAE